MFNLTTEWPAGRVSNVALDTRKLAVLICETVSLWFRAKRLLHQTTSNGQNFRGGGQSLSSALAPKSRLGPN